MIDPTPMHRVDRTSNYDVRPVVPTGTADEVTIGWEAIGSRIRDTGARVVVVEAYPGVYPDDLTALADAIGADVVVDPESALKSPDEIDDLVLPDLTDDPLFGRLTSLTLVDLYDPDALATLRAQADEADGTVAVIGTGARLVADGDLLVLADMPRWEIQQRQRRNEVGNLGAKNAFERASLLYKRSYFVDWRIADRHKFDLWDNIDLVLDTTSDSPSLVAMDAVQRGFDRAATSPFRVVPFFDPGPWGGQWIKEVCDLDRSAVNYAWAFDCVPEENSLLLGFGDEMVEIPSLDLVEREAERLLGPGIVARFGHEFPIRFDFLDTMGGGNLSLQVHPLTAYMREHFGHDYTQDESYYMLDVEPGVGHVYLGVREGVDPDEMFAALQAAHDGGPAFDAEQFVNVVPAARHDHFLIPAGTVHSSGGGGMVLEISATPYIFTFKLWDWERLGLDGRPRPINLARGRENFAWERDTDHTMTELVNAVTPLDTGDGWRAEKTGLHADEFIETHRHWFTGTVPHDTGNTLNVLNLVQGEAAVVESPTGAFPPYEVHYAETFIVPAAVGAYTIRPVDPTVEHATMKAFVRGTR